MANLNGFKEALYIELSSIRWYKLTEISVDRNEGYVAISKLVGDGYVFRVKAMNRVGEELAKSAGMIIGSKLAE